MTMRWPYVITGTVFLLLAAFIAVESLKLRYYTALGPGPGFFPFWLSLILAGLSIIMLVQAGLGRWEDKVPTEQGGRPSLRFILIDT